MLGMIRWINLLGVFSSQGEMTCPKPINMEVCVKIVVVG